MKTWKVTAELTGFATEEEAKSWATALEKNPPRGIATTAARVEEIEVTPDVEVNPVDDLSGTPDPNVTPRER